MKSEVFVVGDVHGEYDLFKQVMEYFEPEKQQLILIGDLNDRGKKSKQAFLLAVELVQKYDAIYLRGNHEEYFLQFLKDPEEMFTSYLYNGGKETIESLLHPGATEEYSPTEIAMFIKSRFKELIAFLLERPLYYVWHEYVFVHAGVDLTKADWHDTDPMDFLWIREPFHTGKNKTGKTIVFGHTITPMLYGDMKTTKLWQSDGKIGIDGGAVFGGSLHAVVFDDQQILHDYEVRNDHAWQPDF